MGEWGALSLCAGVNVQLLHCFVCLKLIKMIKQKQKQKVEWKMADTKLHML